MRTIPSLGPLALAILLGLPLTLPAAEPPASAGAARIELKRDDEQGTLQVLLGGKEAFTYQYGHVDMPHLYPLQSPSGKLLTIQKTEPYPHHRSVWFGDTVQREGQPQTSFYQPLYTQVDKTDPKSPYRDRIRHVKFLTTEVKDGQANLEMQLIWEANLGQVPVMDELRQMRVVALGHGEYFLDCKFTVTAAYGDVTFRSDQAHYAWPYVRMHPQFAVERTRIEKGGGEKGKDKTVTEKGTGTITNSEGEVNGKGTLMKVARWVDYSATVDGVTEGLAIFSNPQAPPPKFFTRDYGTFGPRRPDDQSGKPFVVKKGDSLSQRVGLLIHTGDVKSGCVAERYQQFADGKL
jgi:hypothetical protein